MGPSLKGKRMTSKHGVWPALGHWITARLPINKNCSTFSKAFKTHVKGKNDLIIFVKTCAFSYIKYHMSLFYQNLINVNVPAKYTYI